MVDAQLRKASQTCFLGFPRTRLGWWSAALLLVFLASFTLLYVFVSLGVRGGPAFFGSPWLAGTALAIAGSGTGAGLFGLAAIVRQGERSVLAFLAVVVAAWVLILAAKIMAQSG